MELNRATSLLTLSLLSLLIYSGHSSAQPGGPNRPADNSQQNAVPYNAAQNVNNQGQQQQQQQQQPQPQQQQQQPQQQPIAGSINLADAPDCRNEVAKYCQPHERINNFAVLICLSDVDKGDGKVVSQACQNLLWSYKVQLSSDPRFDNAAFEACKSAVTDLKCDTSASKSGQLLSCLIDNQENIKQPDCLRFLKRMESIVFGDFRLIDNFIEQCGDDIKKFACGRLDTAQDNQPHSQGETIKCLQDRSSLLLAPDCSKQILRISELQSEDFHLDRPLFFACKDDRERFCERVKAGEGRVLKCLMKHKVFPEMSQACRAELTRREKLIVDNYRVSHTLVQKCKDDIKLHKCKPEGTAKQMRLAGVLLCLENVLHQGETVSPECQGEMLDHRRMLMEDFHLSPEIVFSCQEEVKKCGNGNLQKAGATLHCLMDAIRKRQTDPVDPVCRKAVEALIKVADAGSDIRIDPLLHEACQPVADVLCKDVQPGGARVINCLMEHIEDPKMPEDCQEKMFELQYFVVRDWKLDPKLFNECNADAMKLCQAPDQWHRAEAGDEQAGLVLPCLFSRSLDDDDDNDDEKEEDADKGKNGKLSPRCAAEVRRVMRQRAVSVELMPEVEEKCLRDLGTYCSGGDKPEKGEEMHCLQKNLDQLDEDCRKVVADFTAAASKDLSLDHILMKSCSPALQKHCQDLMEKAESGDDLMQCLIEHKAELNTKCKAGVEHYQLTSLKDFQFSFKFKEACKSDVHTNCRVAKTKVDVIECLSEMALNDTLTDMKHRISDKCRDQLKFELLQREEDIKLDPILEKNCRADIERLCANEPTADARQLECLRENQDKLTPACHMVIFKREKQEALMPNTDFLLLKACKSVIKEHCSQEIPRQLLSCLQRHLGDNDMDIQCRHVITLRMITQSLDYRLNPDLQAACKLDIPKFCGQIIRDFEEQEKKEDEQKRTVVFHGKVISCLKKEYARARLSDTCFAQIRLIIMRSMMDFRQDPALSTACESEIADCRKDAGTGQGKVIECLKKEYLNDNLRRNEGCRREVMRLIAEGRGDVQLDPLLYRECAADLKKFCPHVPSGGSAQIKCLVDSRRYLDAGCIALIDVREKMFAHLKADAPESVNDIYVQISSSPSRTYLLVVIFASIGCIFIVGIGCGRCTKRKIREKNK